MTVDLDERTNEIVDLALIVEQLPTKERHNLFGISDTRMIFKTYSVWYIKMVCDVKVAVK